VRTHWKFPLLTNTFAISYRLKLSYG